MPQRPLFAIRFSNWPNHPTFAPAPAPGAPLLARLTKVPAHLNSLLAKLKLLPLFATPPKWAAFPSGAQV